MVTAMEPAKGNSDNSSVDATTAAAVAVVAAAAYHRGCLLDEEAIFWVGGDWQGHASSHYLAAHVTLEVNKHTFGWGWQLTPKLVVCKYQNLSSGIAWQTRQEVFFTKIVRTKHEPRPL